MSNEQKKPRARKSVARSTSRRSPAATMKSLELQNAQLREALAESQRVQDNLRASEARLRTFADSATDAFFLHDHGGTILEVNQQACASLGYTREELIGMTPLDFDVAVEQAFLKQLRARLDTGETVQFETRHRRKDGIVFPVEVRMRPFEAEQRRYGVSIVHDLTEQRQVEEERASHLHFFESMDRVNRAIQGANDLEQMMSAVLDMLLSIFECDRAWLVYPCDPEAATRQVPMERTRSEYPGILPIGVELPLEPVGAAVYRILRDASGPVQFNPTSAQQVPLEMAQGFGVQSFIAMALYPKVGRPWSFGLHQCSYPRVWTPEEIRLFQEIGRRLSDALSSLLMFRNLQESEGKLAEAQRIAHVGHWDHDIAAGRLSGSDETYRIFGVQPQEGIIDQARFLDLIHPEDRPGMAEALVAAIRGDAPYENDYRIVWPTGEVRYIHSQWQVERDKSNRPRHLFGTVQDVSERQLVEATLYERERHSQSLLRLSKSLESAQTYDQVVEAALEEVKTTIGYQNLWIYLLTDDKKYANALVAHGDISESVMTGEGIVTLAIEGDPMLEAIAAATEIVVIEDARTDERTNKEIVAQLGNRTIVNVPIMLLDRHLGAVGTGTFGAEGVRVPTLTEQEYLSTMASHLAVTFDRLHLLDQRKQAEQEHLAHLHFLESMDRVNRAIQGTNDLEQMMSDVLDAILPIFNCDRAFLMYPCDPEAPSWKSPMERTRPEYPGILALGIDLPMDPEVAETLRLLLNSDGPVTFGPEAGHPLPVDVTERFGIKSFMSMALRPKVGKPWQFGIHQCSYARLWTREEERLLWEIGRRLSDALTSLLMLRNLQESEAKFSTAFRSSPSALSVAMAKDHVYVDVNDSFLEWTGYTREEVIGHTSTELQLWAEPDQDLGFRQLLHEHGSVHNFEYAFRRRDGEVRYALVSATFITLGGELCVLAQSNDITDRKRAEQTLTNTHLRLEQALRFTEALLSAIPTPVFYKDREGRYLGCNRAFSEIMGVTLEEIEGKTVFELWPSEHAGIYHQKDLELINNPGRQVYEFRVRDKDGEERPVVYVKDVFRDENDQVAGIVGAFLDITERKQAEEMLRRLNRELRAISDCNQTLLRAVDEQTLLTDICRIVCDEAGYRMAWVGYAGKDDAKSVRPVTWAGVEDGYLATANITWADTERGQGPTGTAIRNRESACIQDFATDPQAAPWRENALRRGYRSSIALPLKDENGYTFGALMIYSTEPNAFTPDEIRLLEELAGDLAFGITTLRTRAERKRAEEALWASSQMLQLVLDNIPAYVFWKDRNSVYLGCNYLSAINSGLSSPQDIIGLTDFDLPWKDTHAELYRADDRQVMETGLPKLNYEETQLTADGRDITLRTSKIPLRNPAGDVIGVLGMFEDITERKRAEEALWESSQMLKLVLDNMPAYVFWKDRDSVYLGCNHLFAANAGLSSPEDIVGLTDFDLPWRDAEAKNYQVDDRQVMETGLPKLNYEETQLTADGRIIAVRTSKVPLRNPAGDVIGVLGAFEDITERKRAEEALRESEKRYRSLFEDSPISLWEEDFSQVKAYFDELHASGVTNFRAYFETHPEAVAHCAELIKVLDVNQATLTLLEVRDKQTLLAGLPRVLADKELKVFREEMITMAEGGQKFESDEETHRTLTGEERLVTIHTSVAPGYEHSLGKVLVSLIDITERKRAEEEIYTLNQELEQRVLVRTAELARAHEHLRAILDTVGEGVVFTDRNGTIEYINPAMERLTGYQATEAIGRNPRIWKSNQTPAATHRQMWSALTSGEIWQGELINRRKDGVAYDAALTTAPLTNPEGQIVGYVGVQRDISRQKELDRLKDQFVSNVSHELRTPLANIMLHVRLLERGKPDKLGSYLQTLRREAERLRKLIEDLLDLSRLDRNVAAIQLAPLDLNQLLEQLVTDRLALAEQRGLTLTHETTPALPLALTDASKLIQVASNLLTNALNYTPRGGNVKVEADVREHEGKPMVAFTVRDTGPGISAQDKLHLFERFYRGAAGRQASAPGTGLGLAISQEIMKRLGGRITVESEVDQGAAFTVWLPAA